VAAAAGILLVVQPVRYVLSSRRHSHLRDVLDGADRMGMPVDIPEGMRYIQISDTLAVEMANSLRCLLGVLGI
jgi:hypothetical protein